MKDVRWPMPLLRRSGLGHGGRSMLRPRSLWGRLRRELRRVRGRPITMLVLEHHPEPEVHAPRIVTLRWAPLPTQAPTLRAPPVVLGAVRKPRRDDVVVSPPPPPEPLPRTTGSTPPPAPPRRTRAETSTKTVQERPSPPPELDAPPEPRRPTPSVTLPVPKRPRGMSAPPVLLKAPRPEPEPPLAPPPVVEPPPSEPPPPLRRPPAPSVALLRPSSTRPPERTVDVSPPRPRAGSTPSPTTTPRTPPSPSLAPIPSPPPSPTRPVPPPPPSTPPRSAPRLVPETPGDEVPEVPVLPPTSTARLERAPTVRPRSRSTPAPVRLRAPQLLLRADQAPEPTGTQVPSELPPRSAPPRTPAPLTPPTPTRTTAPSPEPTRSRSGSTGASKIEAGDARHLLKELRQYQQTSGGKLDSKDGEDRRSGKQPPIAQVGLSRERRIQLARQLGLEGNPEDPVLLQALERAAAGGGKGVDQEELKRRQGAERAKLARAPALRPAPLTTAVPVRERRHQGVRRIAGLLRRTARKPQATASRAPMPVLKQAPAPPAPPPPPTPAPTAGALPTIKTIAAPARIVGRVKAVRRGQRGQERQVEIGRAPGTPPSTARPLPPPPPVPPPQVESKPPPPPPKVPGPDRPDRTWEWGPQGFVPPRKPGDTVVTPPSPSPSPMPDAPIPLPEAPGANRDRSRSAPPRLERPTTPFEAAPSERVQWRSSSFVRAVGGDPTKVPEARAPSWSAPSPLAGARATPTPKVPTEAPAPTPSTTGGTTTVRLTNASEAALERLIERMLVRDATGRRLMEALEERLDDLRRGAAVRRKG